MPFKIVQTVEGNKMLLSIVPSHWERNGILSWPKNSNVDVRDDSAANRPDESFLKFQCVTKRTNLEFYELAEGIVKTMTEKSDTNDRDVDQSATKNVQIKKGSKAINKLKQVPNLETQIKQAQKVCIFIVYIFSIESMRRYFKLMVLALFLFHKDCQKNPRFEDS